MLIHTSKCQLTLSKGFSALTVSFNSSIQCDFTLQTHIFPPKVFTLTTLCNSALKMFPLFSTEMLNHTKNDFMFLFFFSCKPIKANCNKSF